MIYFGTLATGDDTASLRFICIAVTVQIQKKKTHQSFVFPLTV